MLKEVRVIVGTTFESADRVHEVDLMVFKEFENAVLDAFGSYTMTLSVGGRKDRKGNSIKEAVRIYDIAIKRGDQISLVPLVKELRDRANQYYVYFRGSDGVVISI